MKNQAYYIEGGVEIGEMNAGSLASDAAPLIVNCAGLFDTKYDFVTNNKSGRLDYYLMYITDGELNFTLEGGERSVGKGNAIIFPPHFHYKYTYAQSGKTLKYFWVHFTGSHVLSFLEGLKLMPLSTPLDAGQDTHIALGFQSLFDSSSKNGLFSRLEIACELEHILITLAKAVHKDSAPPNPLVRSIEYIKSNFTSDISADKLAEIESLSVSRYNALFTKHMGMPPIRFVIKLRMANACELLENTDMSIRQIGILVGYNDPHFFSKLFKKHVGSSPLQYRQKNF